jgi:transcriptional regulator GlxA family with amidase domain
MPPQPLRIALLGYDGFQTLDLVGPLDAFASANGERPGAYDTRVVTLDGRPIVSETGLTVTPDCALADAWPIDTLILAGGEGLRRPGADAPIAEALRRAAPRLRRVVSVCTGLYGLAASGLADGRRATTHWKFAADLAARFPLVRLEPDAIFIKDGPIYSSAGITAAIDLALALIEEDHGPALAVATARDLVVYLKRAGGQRQYSEPLRFQASAGDRFAELAAWMANHLSEELGVERLAERVHLSPRQFSRRFVERFGRSPAQQVESLRLDAARSRLTGSSASVEAIAAAVGFRSADAFRRAFDRRFGLSPRDYRHRFASANTTAPTGNRHAQAEP